jgi:hypothetical protein
VTAVQAWKMRRSPRSRPSLPKHLSFEGREADRKPRLTPVGIPRGWPQTLLWELGEADRKPRQDCGGWGGHLYSPQSDQDLKAFTDR